MSEIKNIGVLGSTGSIGTQTLDIISEYPEHFRASVLTARRQWRLLADQALKYRPDVVVIGEEEYYAPLCEALNGSGIEVCAGAKAIEEAAAHPKTDTVVTAMVGYSGLLPTISAIKAGKTIALSNKETLVVAGELITNLCKEYGVDIVPVDSEHSAIFQCLVGENRKEMRKIILTASGGPFRTLTKEALSEVTPADALKHPNWDMGAKVTIDSASMMNKGFEMIEARWLFDCQPEKIEVAVHPQSIVHSMVEYRDGSVKAQLGVPDMHTPIRYALSYPTRLHTEARPMRMEDYATLTFERPDMEKFPLLGYAFEAIKIGGTMPCILNAANEITVQAFLEKRIRFTDMPVIARKTMDATPWSETPDLPTLIATNEEARKIAANYL
ncbi:MAG: 1-deoxy-D-xylulose-5-phosphate reductoisomerase [Muribaculaceae bacterium]|nr:1-deoxy-D-xylulose-5-phosphate reductoisomerase [Muribaculaceae bacterium]MDE6523371.1 1-deoxy-D-xylulose-5-phosphate reductoisomerase [Muribaculaceae bacterium]